MTRRAQQRAVPRPTRYRATPAAAAADAGTVLQQERAARRPQRAQVAQERAARHEHRRPAVVVGAAQQACCAAPAQALGVSLRARHALLRVVLRDRTPSLATVGRFRRAARRRASTPRAGVADCSRPRARPLAAAARVRGRKPVLRGVAQARLCWLTGGLATDCGGDTWAEHGRACPAAAQLPRDQRRWQQAEQAWDRWVAQAWGWEQVRAAPRWCTPAGALKTQARAAADVRAALEWRDGPAWGRLRRGLASPPVCRSRDRVQEQRAALPVPGALRPAARAVAARRRCPEGLGAAGARAATARGVRRRAGGVRALAGAAGARARVRVRGVRDGVWRARSLVAGRNSVGRLRQARQQRLTQALLDRPRRHWHLHVFAAGRRKTTTPSGRLGLVVPAGRWWQLLHQPPEQLRQELSALNPAA